MKSAKEGKPLSNEPELWHFCRGLFLHILLYYAYCTMQIALFTMLIALFTLHYAQCTVHRALSTMLIAL